MLEEYRFKRLKKMASAAACKMLQLVEKSCPTFTVYFRYAAWLTEAVSGSA